MPVKIVSSSAYEGPNIFAPVPVVRLVVDLGTLAARPPVSLGDGFTANLLAFLPELDVAADGKQQPDAFASALRYDESLRLGRVVSRVALELQRIAGFGVSYHTAAAGDPPGYHEVVYEHRDTEIGLAAGRAAVAVIAHLANASLAPGDGRPADWDPVDYRQWFISSARERSLDITTAALVRAAVRRGIPWRRLSARTRYVQFGHGRFQKRIHETVTSGTPGIGVMMSTDKGASNHLLFELGLPVPSQTMIDDPKKAAGGANLAARAAEKIGYPVVVKPANMSKGLGVSVRLGDAGAVRRAFGEARKYGQSVIVEQFIEGDDHRILVVDGKVIAAARRIPGHVVGDGRRSIAELVDEVNRDPRRGEGFENILTRLAFDAQAEQMLSERALTRDSIPANDETVYLRRTANISTGGTAVDVTDIIHPDNCRAAVRAARALGLDVAGVDFLSTDIGRSYKEVGGAICEINISPGLRPHWLADDKRDVVGPILDMLYPPGAECRVPIAAITGTDGKTTTTRMVARIMEHAGHIVGFATTDGVYINGEHVIGEDTAGFSGARLVLQDPEIDAAVLETARRGIIQLGLAFDWCDVAAVLNVGNDHIGTDGIRDIDDLASIKSLVARSARGTVVLNADDEHCAGMAGNTRAERLCYVTMRSANPLVAEHVSSGGVAVTLRELDGDPRIVLHQDGGETEILRASDIPAALGGKARFNVQNAMFAIAIGHGLGKSLDHIRAALRSFGCGWDETPGRLNIYDQLPFTVVVDYAHNPQEFEAITSVVRQLDCKCRRIVVFSSPGNRTDRQLRELAAAAAGGAIYDHYVCFRRDDLRGRGPSEVPDLLRDGLLSEGIPQDRITVVPVEEEAVAVALDLAQPGDMVVFLYTEHDRTWARLTA
jgi:cyanophycin synthetase